jgi:2,5-diamino-6-(ribosylamino)-4(3H)-pyrimidinone 5'-phosphate reductase
MFMVPHVVLHIEMSLDGRIDWISPDLAQFYQIAGRWKEDVTLAGCDTLLNVPDEIPAEGNRVFEKHHVDPNDTRPILVVPDSRGRLRSWHYWRDCGLWKDVVALCTSATPREYLDYLEQRHIDIIVTGDDHVDLRAALEELNGRFGVQVVRVDSGSPGGAKWAVRRTGSSSRQRRNVKRVTAAGRFNQ